MALSHILTIILFRVKQLLWCQIDDTLHDNYILLIVIKDDEPSLALVSKVEAPHDAFLIFVIFLISFVFWAHGLGMV